MERAIGITVCHIEFPPLWSWILGLGKIRYRMSHMHERPCNRKVSAARPRSLVSALHLLAMHSHSGQKIGGHIIRRSKLLHNLSTCNPPRADRLKLSSLCLSESQASQELSTFKSLHRNLTSYVVKNAHLPLGLCML